MKYQKGDKVYRIYTYAPSYLFVPVVHREEGEVVGEPFECNGKCFVPAKWRYQPYPTLEFEGNVFPLSEETQNEKDCSTSVPEK